MTCSACHNPHVNNRWRQGTIFRQGLLNCPRFRGIAKMRADLSAGDSGQLCGVLQWPVPQIDDLGRMELQRF